VLAARAGAWGVRVHDVAGSVDAIRVVAAVAPAPQTLALTAPAREHGPTDGHTERWRSA
jgi:dihydropteroate synthase